MMIPEVCETWPVFLYYGSAFLLGTLTAVLLRAIWSHHSRRGNG